MKPEGIRKVLAEQGVEGACLYLAERLEALTAEVENNKPKVDEQLAEPTYGEGN